MRVSKKNIGQMLIMVVASVVCGLSGNFIAENPLPLFKTVGKHEPVAGPVSFSEADADFVRQMSVNSGTIVIDARPAALYSQGHIPGAVNLPLARFNDFISERITGLRAARQLIVYCSGWSCNDSYDLALKLLDNGFKDLLLYRGGMEDWLEKGNAVVR